MHIRYLGTSAAEGIPALFCKCELCEKARKSGGKNIRSRSQMLVNDDLLLDFGPDTFWHVCRYGLDLSKIETLLVTHAHEDHYTPSELFYRGRPFAYLSGNKETDAYDPPHLNVYMSEGSYNYESNAFIQNEIVNNHIPLTFHTVRPFETFAAGNYTVTPLPANHAPGFEALIYLLTDGKSTMLYAHDTGLLPQETVDYFYREKPQIDFASFDCTGMAATHNTGGGYHMNLERNRVTREQLKDAGCVTPKTVFCCNHFSHNGCSTHEELVNIMEKDGFLVSYDGMEYTF